MPVIGLGSFVGYITISYSKYYIKAGHNVYNHTYIEPQILQIPYMDFFSTVYFIRWPAGT